MDLMAEINAYRYSDEQIRARQARRAARQNVLYSQIGLAVGKPSAVDARRDMQREAAGWNIKPEDKDVHDGAPIGGQHPGAAALLIVRQALGEYRLPTEVQLRYGGMKRASGHSAFAMDEGIVMVEATLHSLSGPQHHVYVPVIVREGRILSPSILIHDGNRRVLAQSTFDDIIGMGEFRANVPDRPTMYSPPPDREAASRPKKQVPLLRPGMFSVQPSRRMIGSAVRGFYEPDVSGIVENGTQGKDIPGADGSHLNVGERPTDKMFYPGQKVRMKSEGVTRDRGGVAYKIPRGTRGTVVRDFDGANYAYIVRFEELGYAAKVPREALA